MKVTTLEELDQKLSHVNEAAQVSDNEVRRFFTEFEMDFDLFNKDLPADPFSNEYFKYQMDIYRKVSGREYTSFNEVSAFDVQSMVKRPFPYFTRNTHTTGIHLSALGYVISNLRLAPGARVLEFGPGWGNTTLTLALLGFHVTAVDIEANFCDLIRERAALHGVEVDVVNGDFFSCENVVERFDAILFYECFHHCSDHMRLLRGLHKALKPGGRVYLGAEPIKPDFPLPWGMRMDGESLWAIRQNGWMELGFNNAYFEEALRRTGWIGSWRVSQDVGFANLWELEECIDDDIFLDASNAALHTQIGSRDEGGNVRVKGANEGYILFGPHIALQAGPWIGTVHLVPGYDRVGLIEIEVCDNFGETRYASRQVDLSLLPSDETALTVPFDLSEQGRKVEVRLLAKAAVTMSISGTSFNRRSRIQNHSTAIRND